MLDEVSDLDVLVIPIGGGGLIAGNAIAARGPGYALSSARNRKAGGETDCVADDTVLIGPVSTSKFPASREFAGNFVDSGFRVRFHPIFNQQNQ